MGLNWKIPNIIMILGTIKRGLRQRAYSLTSSKHHRNALVTYVPNQVVQYSESKVFTCFGHVNYVRNSKVPLAPKWQPVTKTLPSTAAEVPSEVVDKLERLALVDFRNQEGIDCLEKAIQFADQLHIVDSVAVEPLDSVLHDRSIHLRNDTVTVERRAEELLQLSTHVIDEYFVAPPGNIPLEKK